MKKYLATLILSALFVAASGYYLYQKYHPFTSDSSEVHVHSDFAIILNDKKISLTDKKYQSSTEQLLHKHVHLHDGDDKVVHRHAEGITFKEFLQSLGYTLTNECLTDNVGKKFCTDQQNVLTLYVNKHPKTVLTEYIPQEGDQILLYFGAPENPYISSYLDSISSESCIYSGTCPERGTAPAESCGLTCEL
jgi:hypothetical protein